MQSKFRPLVGPALFDRAHKASRLISHGRSSFSTKFTNISGMDRSRSGSSEQQESDEALSHLERSVHINPERDARTQAHFSEIRVKGPKSREAGKADGGLKWNRAGIEKPHAEWGWSPFHDKSAEQWNWKDNPRPQKDIPHDEKASWSDALTTIGSQKYYNPDDLTTFEGYSESARSATFKAALNVGVHWGKDKKQWHQSMGPYLKGVVHDRHIFDLSLTIANLRKMIRLLQSLVMDECNILFVCNDIDVEMKTLARIMCTRCNMPLLEDRWKPGSLSNWNHMAEHYRGPGQDLDDGKRPDPKQWRKTKLHRLIKEPPDFIFLLTRKHSDILVHEANRVQIPVGALCDSDDSTRDLQYVIPCNTQSIQSVHFVLDMMTRGILEAQSKMDSAWWSRQRDQYVDRDALMAAEIEWQYKFDPYEQKRHASFMMAGDDSQDDLDIATNYVKQDQDVLEEAVNDTTHNRIALNRLGHVTTAHRRDRQLQQQRENDEDATTQLDTNEAERSRRAKLQGVRDNASTEYMRRYEEKKEAVTDVHQEYVKKFDWPDHFASTSDFALSMLQDYTRRAAKDTTTPSKAQGKSY